MSESYQPNQDRRIAEDVLGREWLKYKYHDLGKTQVEIAAGVGCHPRTVGDWLQAHDLRKKPDEYHVRYDVPTREWLEHQYLELDKSIRELAAEIGCSVQPVWGWIKHYGIKKPKAQLAAKHSRRMTGKGNPAWVNGSSWGYQYRKLKRSGLPEVCRWCGTSDEVQIHHMDHDRGNHELENLTWLCHKCNCLEAYLWHLEQLGRAEVLIHKNDRRIEIRFK